MNIGGTDRRGLFQSLVGEWLERLVDEAERRVVQERYLRPPGALPEVGFLAACTRCGECVRACPVHAIVTAPMSAGLAAGTPYLELERQPCVACTGMPCVEACPTDALTAAASGWTGYRLAELEFHPERCITFQGTACQACADACPMGAAALAIDEGGHPVLRREGCVGCGVCVRACVTHPPSFTFHFAEG